MRQVPSKALRAHVIWLPALPTDKMQDAVEASSEFSDERVVYSWDGEMKVADPFGKSLGLNRFAWDIYLLYNRGEKIKNEEPAAPEFWMHQLMGADDLAPILDSVVLRERVEALVRQ